MATYLELQTEIADDLNRSDLSSQIQSAIKDAIKYYERTRFWFNEESSTTPTVASQQTYTIPSDALFLDMLEITVSGRKWQLNKLSWTDFEDKWSQNTTTGVPTDWAVFQDVIYLGPTPADVYTLTFSYVKSLTTLSADSDSNEWTTAAKDLIRFHAKSSIYENVIMAFDIADRMTLRCLRELSSLTRQNEQRVMTGKVKAVYL